MLKKFMALFFIICLYSANAKQMYSLKDIILNKQNDYYTIVLATVLPSNDYKSFIENNEIDYNSIAYNFGQKEKYVKIIFGAFKSYEEAFEHLIELNTNLLANKPYIEKVNKHISLFYKYNNKL